jgi:large subunit ribosomal protein L10
LAYTKEQKTKLLAEYEQWFKESPALFMMEYNKMSMKEINDFRARVRGAGGQLHVAKNTLLERALDHVGFEHKTIVGTTLLGVARDDIPALAKVFSEAAKNSEVFRIKGGFMDRRQMAAEEVKMLADLPPMPIVQARLLGVLSAPATNLVRTLAEPARQVAAVLKSYSEKAAPAAA